MRLLTKDKIFYKSLVSLAIPVALQNLITFAVNFADNLMVGSLGDNAVSGVYMGNQIQTFLQIFSAGIEGAILILASQYWGRNDKESIKKIVATGFHFSLVIGIIISTVCFVVPDTVISIFTNDMIFIFLIVIPSAIIASYLGAPAWVVFALLKSDQILKCFVAVVKINRFNWMKNLTRNSGDESVKST